MKINRIILFVFFVTAPVLFASNFSQTDDSFAYTFDIPNHTYHKYCKNVYSQNGEDGLLEQLIKELNIVNGTFCEFGASNGISQSNTYNLILNYNFSGMAIELDKHSYMQCVINYQQFPNVQVFHGAVMYNDSSNNLDAWLKRGGLPKDLDILSIDIDGDDYFVWKGLAGFTPKIVIIETNSYRDPVYDELPSQPSDEYNIDPLKQWFPERIAIGCSFISAVKLGLQKGYIPVAYTGNIVFVRKDLIDNLKEFPYIVSNDVYDYLPLYSHLVLWGNQWTTNTGLMLNVAIRDYYLQFNSKHIDVTWLNKRVQQLMINEIVRF